MATGRTLPEGVTNKDSHRWQKAARVPEPEFEAYIEEARRKDDEVTTAGVGSGTV